MAVRAEVGRLPRPARERLRRASSLVAERPPAPALLPGAPSAGRAPPSPLRARRGDRHLAAGRDRLRRHADAPAPGESRVRKLSAEIPASFVAFDILVWKGKQTWQKPLRERRVALERDAAAFTLSPATTDRQAALGWLERFEAAGLDGVIAKRLDAPYRAGERDAVVKVKPERTADCVVAGIRWRSEGDRIATLLLGLYGDDGELDYVGTAAVAPARHDEIAELVRPLLRNAPERRFSEPNRWGGGELEEAAVRPELVVEVRFDKVQGNRFRHGTKLIRFRPDKEPGQCTWRELRPVRGPDDPSFESLVGM
jgi:ATP-dependent DNA ligase